MHKQAARSRIPLVRPYLPAHGFMSGEPKLDGLEPRASNVAATEALREPTKVWTFQPPPAIGSQILQLCMPAQLSGSCTF